MPLELQRFTKRAQLAPQLTLTWINFAEDSWEQTRQHRLLQSAVSLQEEIFFIQKVLRLWFTSSSLLLDVKLTGLYLTARLVPFVIGVYFDGDEVTEDAAADMAQTNEQGKIPGGIIGFSLTYKLQC